MKVLAQSLPITKTNSTELSNYDTNTILAYGASNYDRNTIVSRVSQSDVNQPGWIHRFS